MHSLLRVDLFLFEKHILEMEKESRREILYCWFTLQLAAMARPSWSEAESLELLLGLPESCFLLHVSKKLELKSELEFKPNHYHMGYGLP